MLPPAGVAPHRPRPTWVPSSPGTAVHAFGVACTSKPGSP